MSGTPDIFAEDKTVGGTPCFAWVIRRCLPRNRKTRETIFRVQMVILTYITYAAFNMSRRPMSIVKTKIIEECETQNKPKSPGSHSGQQNITSYQWCNETFFVNNVEEFMGFLDAVYILSYGIFLYMSGIIADCYNSRYYLTVGCFLSGFFCALLGLSDVWSVRSFKFFSTVLVLFGAAQSTGWPILLSSVTHWYSGGKRGMFFGLWNTHNYMGSILGIYTAGYFVDKVWGWSFFIPGFVIALIGFIALFYMVMDPNDLHELDNVESSSSISVSKRGNPEVPPWLKSNKSIKLYDALLLPGVLEYSMCMFFERMVGYTFLFWVPVFIRKATKVTATVAAYYSIAYVLGGSIGGILAGILVDLFQRAAVVCGAFLLLSIPVLLLGQVSQAGANIHIDIPVYMAIGLFVEAPYVVTSTTVSAELGMHKMIKRNHRALSTIGGIVEGTGAMGAAIGTYICGVVSIRTKWTDILYLLMIFQFIATLCLSRQFYKDFVRKQERRTLKEYWRAPAIF